MLNDLWSYSIDSQNWTWVSGSSSFNQPGEYGTKGVSSSTNYPGARYGSVSWFDSLNQTLWLFGGAMSYIERGNIFLLSPFFIFL